MRGLDIFIFVYTGKLLTKNRVAKDFRRHDAQVVSLKCVCMTDVRQMNPSYSQSVNTGWYSLVKIAFVPICACRNTRRIWRHNASTSRSRDVTDQLKWCSLLTSSLLEIIGKSPQSWPEKWYSRNLCIILYIRRHAQAASIVQKRGCCIDLRKMS